MTALKTQPHRLARAGWWLGAGAAVLGLAAPAQAHTPELPIVPGHPTGHVKHPTGNKWPPEPEGLRGVRNFSDFSEGTRRRNDEDSQFSRTESRFRQLPQLQWLAGRKLTRLSIENSTQKPDATADTARSAGASLGTAGSGERRLHYFDRQANQTITVHESVEGKTTVTTVPATTYQPEITAAETSEAINLARRYFTLQGTPRVQALKGFGILAYQPTGTGFYAGRVIYVSFHFNSDAPPEYVAWVDLSRQTILSARQERAQ